MKENDKVISITNTMVDIFDPNIFLMTYAQLEEGMEGYIEKLLGDEILVNFHGITVVIPTEEFAKGDFMLVKEITELRLVHSEDDCGNKLN